MIEDLFVSGHFGLYNCALHLVKRTRHFACKRISRIFYFGRPFGKKMVCARCSLQFPHYLNERHYSGFWKVSIKSSMETFKLTVLGFSGMKQSFGSDVDML